MSGVISDNFSSKCFANCSRHFHSTTCKAHVKHAQLHADKHHLSPVASRVEVTQDFRGSCWKQPTKHCFDLIHPWRSFISMSRATMTSLPFIHLFLVQFLLTGPCGQCNPVDGAAEQFSLTQETQSLLLNIDWRVGTASGRDDLSRCTCYTELKLSLQKAALPKVLLNGMR